MSRKQALNFYKNCWGQEPNPLLFSLQWKGEGSVIFKLDRERGVTSFFLLSQRKFIHPPYLINNKCSFVLKKVNCFKRSTRKGIHVCYTLRKNVGIIWTFHIHRDFCIFHIEGRWKIPLIIWCGWSLQFWCGFSTRNNRHLTDNVDFPCGMCTKKKKLSILCGIPNACRSMWKFHIYTLISLLECSAK